MQLKHKQPIMEQHLTAINITNDLPLQAGNNPLSNDPAGTADIEKGKPAKSITEKPDIITPETEKPDVHEMPQKDEPEIVETDIDEAPDTEIIEVPDTDTEKTPTP